jgi:glycosyltransferase involved in cell wall biosynthesis
MNIAIILPAYNEELTIAATIEEFYKELPKARIVVVNNNSSDGTADIAAATLKRIGAFGEVIAEPRQGKGNAVRRAFTDIEADIYVMCDADCTYPANRIHDLIRPVAQNEADLVTGDRFTFGHYEAENDRSFHSFGNRAVRWLINMLFGARRKDIMTGYMVFSRKFIRNYPILVEGFQLETDIALHALDKRFRVLEIPVEYRNRPAGSVSKLNTFADGTKVIFTIASILRYYRPLFFFTAMALCLALLGLVAAIPVFGDWLIHRFIYHVPLAVLAASLELTAVMALGVGLILDSITHQYRMTFERQLLNTRRDTAPSDQHEHASGTTSGGKLNGAIRGDGEIR